MFSLNVNFVICVPALFSRIPFKYQLLNYFFPTKANSHVSTFVSICASAPIRFACSQLTLSPCSVSSTDIVNIPHDRIIRIIDIDDEQLSLSTNVCSLQTENYPLPHVYEPISNPHQYIIPIGAQKFCLIIFLI